jgi:hypothetical protein
LRYSFFNTDRRDRHKLIPIKSVKIGRRRRPLRLLRFSTAKLHLVQKLGSSTNEFGFKAKCSFPICYRKIRFGENITNRPEARRWSPPSKDIIFFLFDNIHTNTLLLCKISQYSLSNAASLNFIYSTKCYNPFYPSFIWWKYKHVWRERGKLDPKLPYFFSLFWEEDQGNFLQVKLWL